jgi:hypothetical protein
MDPMTFNLRTFSRWSLALLLLVSMGHGAWAAKIPPAPAEPPPGENSIPQSRYFFNIDLDPRYQIIGIGSLSEEAAAKANDYHFIYDDAGRLRRIEFQRAGALMPDPFFCVASIDFEYAPGVERRWYHDAKGQLMKNAFGVSGEELTLNPKGFPTDIANLDASGASTRDSSGVVNYIRILDNRGRLIAGRRVGLLGTDITDDDGYFETRSAYDNSDLRFEYGNYDSAANLLNDNDGVALVRTIYTYDPDTRESIETYFDASGLAVEEKGSGVHQLRRVVDKRGFTVSESYFDITGAPCLQNGSQIHERRMERDDLGNEISKSFFDIDGKPKDEKNDVVGNFARVIFKYDDKNRVTEREYFGDDGAPQVLLNLGAAIVRQEYDDEGNISHREFFDGLGNPSKEVRYGAEALRIRRDGDTTFVLLRDGNDQPRKSAVGGYYSLSYKGASDNLVDPLLPTNHFYDLNGHPMSRLRVFIINPHLHMLETAPVMQASARCGACAAGLGALLACLLALRKSYHTKRRTVYVPTRSERFLGWFSVFAILEGSLRFFMTIYWAWVRYENGRVSYGIYILEAIFIVFFLYRLMRIRVTLRVLNISRTDIERLIRAYFAQAGLEPKWDAASQSFIVEGLTLRLDYSPEKCHAYLSFSHLHRPELARGLANFIRAQAGTIQSAPRTRPIAFYYPSVALCYFLLSITGFYTLWQLLKGS